MFCNQCGQKNSDHAKFCSGCGNKLETHKTFIENESLHEQTITLWNPTTATILGFFFTAIFTAFFIEKNWKELGLKNKANDVLIFSFGIVMFGLYTLFFNIIEISKYNFISFLAYILGINLWFIISMYITNTRQQVKYIRNNLNNKYNKKSFKEYYIIAPIMFILIYFHYENTIKNSTPVSTPEISEYFAILIGIFSICYLFFSSWEWLQRKSKNEKPYSKDIIDWIFTLLGYLLVSAFAYLPFFFLFKSFELSIFTTYWYLGVIFLFMLLIFLRRT